MQARLDFDTPNRWWRWWFLVRCGKAATTEAAAHRKHENIPNKKEIISNYRIEWSRYEYSLKTRLIQEKTISIEIQTTLISPRATCCCRNECKYPTELQPYSQSFHLLVIYFSSYFFFCCCINFQRLSPSCDTTRRNATHTHHYHCHERTHKRTHKRTNETRDDEGTNDKQNKCYDRVRAVSEHIDVYIFRCSMCRRALTPIQKEILYPFLSHCLPLHVCVCVFVKERNVQCYFRRNSFLYHQR